MFLVQPPIAGKDTGFPAVGVNNLHFRQLPGSSEAAVVVGHDELLEAANIRCIEEEIVHLATFKVVLDENRIGRFSIFLYIQFMQKRNHSHELSHRACVQFTLSSVPLLSVQDHCDVCICHDRTESETDQLLRD